MRGLVLVVVLLAGCDRVFGLDTVHSGDAGTTTSDGSPSCGAPAPRQQIVGAFDLAADTGTFALTPSETGNTFVLVAAVATKTVQIQSVTDDGGNTWTRAAHIASMSGSLISTEIWYATATKPATMVTVAEPVASGRATSINVTEWRCAFTGLDAETTNTDVAGPTTMVSTGTLSTAHPTLLVAGMALPDSAANPALATSGFGNLTSFNSGTLAGAGAWSWQPPGTYTVEWGLEGPSDWVGALVALTAP